MMFKLVIIGVLSIVIQARSQKKNSVSSDVNEEFLDVSRDYDYHPAVK